MMVMAMVMDATTVVEAEMVMEILIIVDRMALHRNLRILRHGNSEIYGGETQTWFFHGIFGTLIFEMPLNVFINDNTIARRQ